MIEKKDLPSEYVSIRQVWLRQINRCNEAISNKAKPDSNEYANYEAVGRRTVISSVRALYLSLVDYGEAKVKTDCKKIWTEAILPKISKQESLDKITNIYQNFFEKIIEILNRYGMLFDSQPQGYTNVEMKSVQ